ncbi:DUF4393 domain-containing protein, partial [Pseudomonas sp. PA-3-6H]|nr:DUF4393 domain-containing protein [Pseudomonas sp. PA-3-6H]
SALKSGSAQRCYVSDDNKVKETIDAVKGLVEAVPIYQDLAQPAVKQVGKALETVAKTINIALAPVGALVWGYEQCQGFIANKVAEKLKNVPPEDIVTPKPNVAGPAIEALRYTGHEESLSNMYANLLAASMTRRIAREAHPAFVEIIKQLTPDEAKLIPLLIQERALPLLTIRSSYIVPIDGRSGSKDIVSNYSTLGREVQVEHLDMMPSYLSNICRLGLAEIPNGIFYTSPGIYDALESSPFVLEWKRRIEKDKDFECKLARRMLKPTPLGELFARICTDTTE